MIVERVGSCYSYRKRLSISDIVTISKKSPIVSMMLRSPVKSAMFRASAISALKNCMKQSKVTMFGFSTT